MAFLCLYEIANFIIHGREGGYGGVFGTFFVCGLAEEDFCSLTPEQMERFKKEYHNAEIPIGAKGNEPITLKVSPKDRPPNG